MKTRAILREERAEIEISTIGLGEEKKVNTFLKDLGAKMDDAEKSMKRGKYQVNPEVFTNYSLMRVADTVQQKQTKRKKKKNLISPLQLVKSSKNASQPYHNNVDEVVYDEKPPFKLDIGDAFRELLETAMFPIAPSHLRLKRSHLTLQHVYQGGLILRSLTSFTSLISQIYFFVNDIFIFVYE